ncbi:MAG: hypothetical protein IBJ10_11365 [Phycisphaerales bacterium]|nr:hypothetical protein [Phycisphaerales bacterium]
MRTPAALLAALATQSVLAANVFHVDASAPAGGNGLSWGAAFNDLQDALAAAGAGDQVRVAQGTYKPDRGTGNRHMFFVPNSGVTMLGGFAGLAGPSPELRDPDAYRTTLSGDLLGDDAPNFANRSDNTTNIFYIFSKTGVVIDGFTVRSGHADLFHNFTSGVHGGGIETAFSEITVRNCVFVDNLAWRGGGAVALLNAYGPVPRFENCRFFGNRALVNGSTGGGAVYTAGNTTPVFVNCVFVGNSTPGGGGAIATNASSFTLVNCTIAQNTANAGGGVYVNSGQFNASNSVLWSNNAGGDAERKQIWTNVGAATVQNSSLPMLSLYAGNGNLVADPQFQALAGPDGSLGTADDDARPAAASPVVNAGDNAHIPAGVATDLAGGARVTGGAVDLGAYETPCVGDSNADAIVNFTDLNNVLSSFNTAGFGRAGDVDGDGDVDFADLNLVISAFNSAC